MAGMTEAIDTAIASSIGPDFTGLSRAELSSVEHCCVLGNVLGRPSMYNVLLTLTNLSEVSVLSPE